MLIEHNEKEWKAVSTHRTCSYHKKHPGVPFAGCTCASTYVNEKVDRPFATPGICIDRGLVEFVEEGSA